MPIRELNGDRSGVDHTKEVILTTSEGKEFVLSRDALKLSKILRDILEDSPGDEETVIPVNNVDAATLQCVAPYLERYATQEPNTIDKPLRAPLQELLNDWDKEYVYKTLFRDGDEKQHEPLFKTLLAGNFLGVEPLRDLCCAAIANMLRGKTPEQIKEVFGVTEDFTPEEIKQVEKEYPFLKEQGEN
eukprot:TRINITY_DN12462_c0_g1_i1.p1 TRINITY_DN12462_c0_g1~~TRINITY_DN12462_c0_g1_i1.p1  ORF type:complete len:203 (+),score=35.74 TRINITY_DN12462_c0_g1_i1:48-611(+)